MNKSDIKRNYPMLNGRFGKQGYDWWWHNFTAVNEKTGEEKSFFVEYFICNPKLATKDSEPVLGQLPANKEKGLKPSYLMVKAGWWGKDAAQLHRFIGWNKADIGTGGESLPLAPAAKASSATLSAGDPATPPTPGYYILAEDCYASENLLKGSINITPEQAAQHPEWMCDSGSMEWEIHIDKKVAFNVGYGAGTLFRTLKAFEMYWHAEGMKSLYSGKITANGQNYIIKPESSYGYADKNWGSNFTSPWVWLSSNDLVSKMTGKRLQNSVFDIGGGRPKAFGIAMNRKLLSDFWYEGKSYEFNFSKFWTFTKTRFDCKETETEIQWYVRQETTKAVMESNITCKKTDMLLVNYESPDGLKRHNRLWNGGNGHGTVKLYKKAHGTLKLIDEVEAGHIGCEYGEYD